MVIEEDPSYVHADACGCQGRFRCGYHEGYENGLALADRYRRALEDIVKHMEIVAPSATQFSTVAIIARRALEEE